MSLYQKMLNDGVTSLYSLNKFGSRVIELDNSGNGYDGKWNSIALPTFATSPLVDDDGLDLGIGISKSVTLNDPANRLDAFNVSTNNNGHPELSPSGPWTIELFTTADNQDFFPDEENLFEARWKDIANDDNAVRIAMDTGDGVKVYINQAGVSDSSGSHGSTDNSDVKHIVVTRGSTGDVKVYVGNLDTATTTVQVGSTLVTTKDTSDGGEAIQLMRYFWDDAEDNPDGETFDYLAIYSDTELTLAQIQQHFDEAVSATDDLIGSIAGVGGMSGELSFPNLGNGQVDGVGALTASLSATLALEGSLDGVGFMEGTLETPFLKGSVNGVGGLSGDLPVQKELIGSVDGQSNITGTLGTYRIAGPAWVRKASEQGAAPVFIVTINDGKETHKFEYTFGSTSVFGNPVSIANISPVGRNIDPFKRKPQVSNIEIDFIDDGVLRDIIKNSDFHLYNKLVTVEIGFVGLDEGDFAPYFKGTIEEILPKEGHITLSVVDYNHWMKKRKMTGEFIQTHPLQVMKSIIEECKVPASSIDETSFDPDYYKDAATFDIPISHYNLNRSDDNQDSTAIKNDTESLKLVDELLRLIPGMVWTDEAGKVAFKLYYPSRTPRATLTDDDIDLFVQKESFNNICNQIKGYYRFVNSEGDNPAQSPVRDEDAGGNYLGKFVMNDRNAQLSFSHSNAATDEVTPINKVISTKWMNGGLGVVLGDIASGTSAPVISIFGSSTAAFTGVRQIIDTGAAEADLSDADGRYALLALYGNDGSVELVQCSVAKAFITDRVTRTSAVKNEYNGVANKNSPSNLTTLPPPFSGLGTISQTGATYDIPGGPVVAATGTPDIPAIFNGEFTVKTRGLYSTSAQDFTSQKTLIDDVTMLVDAARKIIGRFANGISIIEITTDITKMDLQLGDFVRIDNDVFLNKGFDGILPADKEWEIVMKEVNISEDNPHIKLRLAEVNDVIPLTGEGSNITAMPVHVKHKNFIDNLIDAGVLHKTVGSGGGTVTRDKSAWTSNFGTPGYKLTDAGGLNLEVGPGMVSGTYRAARTYEPACLELEPSSKITVFVDIHTGHPGFDADTTNTAFPEVTFLQAKIGEVETDATDITSLKDTRSSSSKPIDPTAFVRNKLGPQVISPSSEYTGNLVRNGDFGETDADTNELHAWKLNFDPDDEQDLFLDTSPVASGLSIEASDTLTGSQGILFTGPNTSPDTEIQTDRFQPVTEGGVYKIDVIHKASASADDPPLALKYQFFDETETSVAAATSVDIDRSTSFATHTTIIEVPSSAKLIKIGLLFKPDAGGNESVIVDRVSLKKEPCFFVGTVGGVTAIPATEGVIPFVASTDRGDCWNDGSEYFEAKEGGFYSVDVGVQMVSVDAGHLFFLRVQQQNSSGTGIDNVTREVYANSSADPVSLTISHRFEMEPGERIQFFYRRDGSAANIESAAAFNRATIIGPL